ncbi:hypothetical protein FOA52_013758 [Chlamydomonas sp. UWO 241]|nr:hypothetical protein FOA52_013758 [Chlamydomonas sp. UWO 241]
MRAVVTRVRSASVEVDGKIVSSIGPGLLCLVGVTSTDTPKGKAAEYVCKKILKTRFFAKADQARASWDEDVVERKGDILLVSQFTLYGRLKKGTKPDFSKAMPPTQARECYDAFVELMRESYEPTKVRDGVFGAMMNVASINDGPVTFIIDSDGDTASSTASLSSVDATV